MKGGGGGVKRVVGGKKVLSYNFEILV